jgi:hypothetical protein
MQEAFHGRVTCCFYLMTKRLAGGAAETGNIKNKVIRLPFCRNDNQKVESLFFPLRKHGLPVGRQLV